MLALVVQETEVFDEETSEFRILPGFTLRLEHSLVALSKWESIWKKPFLVEGEKTSEEIYSYISCMSLDGDLAPEVFPRLLQEHFDRVGGYIDENMTATWFTDVSSNTNNGETITNELIYHWMIEFQVPVEFESWHLSHLFTLIRVRSVKLSKPKKSSPEDIRARNRRINEMNREKYGSTG